MSLRELARKHLEELSRSRCPVSGHIGMSGPDKTAQPHISLSVAPVRTPDTIRTSISCPDSLSGSDSVNGPDKPDAPDNSDKPDRSDKVAAPAFVLAGLQREADRRNLTAQREGRTDRFCACGRLARLAWPEGNRREVWRCDECAPTAGRA
jgi:hypothetical protein